MLIYRTSRAPPSPAPHPQAETRPAGKTSGAGKLVADIAAATIVIAGTFFLINRNGDNGEATPGNGADNTTLVAQNDAATQPAQEAESASAQTENGNDSETPAATETEPLGSAATSEEEPSPSAAVSTEQSTQPKAQPREERRQAQQTEPKATKAKSKPRPSK